MLLIFVLLLPLAAESAAGGDAATLVGIGAILAAIVPLAIAVVNRKRKPDTGSEDVELLTQRVAMLKDSVNDLTSDLERCRHERQTTEAELRIAHLKTLELEATIRALRGAP